MSGEDPSTHLDLQRQMTADLYLPHIAARASRARCTTSMHTSLSERASPTSHPPSTNPTPTTPRQAPIPPIYPSGDTRTRLPSGRSTRSLYCSSLVRALLRPSCPSRASKATRATQWARWGLWRYVQLALSQPHISHQSACPSSPLATNVPPPSTQCRPSASRGPTRRRTSLSVCLHSRAATSSSGREWVGRPPGRQPVQAFFCMSPCLHPSDTSTFGSLQALPSWLNTFGTPGPNGAKILTTYQKSIANSGG